MWTSVPLCGHDVTRDPPHAGRRPRSRHGDPAGGRRGRAEPHGSGSSHRTRSSHRPSAAQVDGIPWARDLHRRAGLPTRAQAPRVGGDGDARAASSGPRTTRPRSPGADEWRERPALRPRPRPARLHRRGGVTERAEDDRRRRRRSAAHRWIRRQGVPRVRPSDEHRRAPRDRRSRDAEERRSASAWSDSSRPRAVSAGRRAPENGSPVSARSARRSTSRTVRSSPSSRSRGRNIASVGSRAKRYAPAVVEAAKEIEKALGA